MTEKKKTKTKSKKGGQKPMTKSTKAATPAWQTKKGLTELYSKQKMTAMDIAKKFKIKRHNVLYYLHKFDIPIWSKKTKSTKKVVAKKTTKTVAKSTKKGTVKKARKK